MKKQILSVVFIAALIIVAIVFNSENQDNTSFAGGNGFSLKKLNEDTTKTALVAVAEANVTSDQSLAQLTCIGGWERQYKTGYFVGGDIVGTVSTQFGIMCPTYDVRGGLNLNAFQIEGKVGNFNRNSVTTTGFDPQFANFLCLLGEGASVSNAVQLSLISKHGKMLVGHQGGDKFYSCDGNFYASAELNIQNVALSGGINFTENPTGYAAVKWANKNNLVALTCNNLGGDAQNFVLSFVRSNIPVYKGITMNIANALWHKSQNQGVQVVTAFNMNNTTLYAQVGGQLNKFTNFTPMVGVGVKYKL